MKLSNDPNEDKARKAAAAAALALLGLAGLQSDPRTFTVGSRLDALMDQLGPPAPGGTRGGRGGRGGASLPGIIGLQERALPGGIGRGRRNGTFLLPLQMTAQGGGSWRSPAISINQNFLGGAIDNPSTGSDEWVAPWAGLDFSANQANNSHMIPASGTLHSLNAQVSVAPGAGNSWEFTVFVNGAPTALGVTLSNSETREVNLTNSISVSIWDLVVVRCSPTSSPASARARWSLIFTPDNPQEIAILAGSGLSAASTMYINLQQIPGGTGNDRADAPMPCGGYFKDMRVRHTVAPGIGKSFTWTLRVNGNPTALTCFVEGNNLTATNTSNNISVSRGDVLCWTVVPSGSPATGISYLSCMFVPDTAGQQIITTATSDSPLSGSTEYNQLCLGYDGVLWTGTQVLREQSIRPCTLHSLIVTLSVAPGAGNSRDFTLMRNGAPTALVATISNLETVGHDLVNSVVIADGDLVYMRTTPTSNPVNARPAWGIVVN